MSLPGRLPPGYWPKGRYQVGDRVRFRFVLEEIEGTVTEDRGPIGVGGRRIYQVTAPMDPEPMVFELPEEDLRPAAEEPASKDRR
ncbi:MAG TPA: hypothetical protein VIL46_10155 [Gemmataceae bacterium]